MSLPTIPAGPRRGHDWTDVDRDIRELRVRTAPDTVGIMDRPVSPISAPATVITDITPMTPATPHPEAWRQRLFKAVSDGDVRSLDRVMRDANVGVNDPVLSIDTTPTDGLLGGVRLEQAAAPLHAAAALGKLGVVRWLLMRGADPSARDGLHRTPKEVASSADIRAALDQASRGLATTQKSQDKLFSKALVTITKRITAVEGAVEVLYRRLRVPVDGSSGAPLPEATHDPFGASPKAQHSELSLANRRIEELSRRIATVEGRSGITYGGADMKAITFSKTTLGGTAGLAPGGGGDLWKSMGSAEHRLTVIENRLNHDNEKLWIAVSLLAVATIIGLVLVRIL